MGAVVFGIPTSLALKLRDLSGARIFVETGTFLGDTALWASDHFESVYTIEHDRERYRNASIRMADMKNVHLLNGDSRTLLPRVLHNKDTMMFWLDAHWCLEGASEARCPLLDELELVLDRPPGDIILIDDANFFIEPPPLPVIPGYWPHMGEILKLLHEHERYPFVVDDVIVISNHPALPVALALTGRQQLERELHDLHLQRLQK